MHTNEPKTLDAAKEEIRRLEAELGRPSTLASPLTPSARPTNAGASVPIAHKAIQAPTGESITFATLKAKINAEPDIGRKLHLIRDLRVSLDQQIRAIPAIDLFGTKATASREEKTRIESHEAKLLHALEPAERRKMERLSDVPPLE